MVAQTGSTSVEPIPIILVGFGDAASGFARVVHSIAENLPSYYEVHHLAVNIRTDASEEYGWKIYPSDIKGDHFGEIKLRRLIEQVKPRIVWFLNDFWYLARYYPIIRDGNFKSIGYMPLDGKVIKPEMLGALQFYDEIVTYNDFSRQEIAQRFQDVKRVDPEFVPPRLSVIPHGVDQEKFTPIKDYCCEESDEMKRREKARLAFYGNDCSFLDGFIVLNANQNAERKRLDLTLRGFALFAAGKPTNVKLHLHCDSTPKDESHRGVDVLALAEQLDISERLVLTQPSISDEQMNLLYNACNVGINTSFGEGWGLVSFEHAATRAAQIVPNHTACSDLWRGAAELLDAPINTEKYSGPLEQRVTNPEAVAEALEKLYRDRSYREEMAERALQVANRTDYQWQSVGREWDQFFLSMLGLSNFSQSQETHHKNWDGCEGLTVIEMNDYRAIWRRETATSIPEFPVVPTFHSYVRSAREFWEGEVYPARAVDSIQTKFLRSFDEGACPINYSDLCQNHKLRDVMLAEREERAGGRTRPQPHVIVEHCLGCGAKVVKDGCKELLNLMYTGADVPLHVTQVSGLDWTQSRFDMRLACSCPS